jgi:F0F1-type ATP synthase gamma subunit
MLASCAVKLRMRSVQNIAKITSAMKMVAASKMRVAQISTERSRGLLAPFIKLLGDLPGVSSPLIPAYKHLALPHQWPLHCWQEGGG